MGCLGQGNLCVLSKLVLATHSCSSRTDGPSGPYFIVPLGIVIGLALPVVPWLLYRKLGWKWLPYVNTAVLACKCCFHEWWRRAYLCLLSQTTSAILPAVPMATSILGWLLGLHHTFISGNIVLDGSGNTTYDIYPFKLLRVLKCGTTVPIWCRYRRRRTNIRVYILGMHLHIRSDSL